MKTRYDFSAPPRSVELASDQVVHRGPCLLVGVVVSGVGAAAKVQLHDGIDTNGERRLTVQAPDTYSFSPELKGGIEFRSGMYANLNAVTDLTTVLYYPGAMVAGPGEEGSD